MDKKLSTWLSILVLPILACGTFSVGLVTPSPSIDPVAGIVEETLTAMETEENSTGEGSATPQTLDWLRNAEGQGIDLPGYLGGLFYRSTVTNQLYLVNQNGTAVDISPPDYSGYAASLSPETFALIYTNTMEEGEEIMLYDPGSGESRMLTNTPTLFERGAQWWPANAGKIVFNYIPEDQLGPWSGYLGAYDIQTGEYLTLDDQNGSFSEFAPSPDGRTIAYDDGGQPMLYDWENGSSPLDQDSFGIRFETFRAPAWSPDGRKIAYWVTGGQSPTNGNTLTAILIVDFENHTAAVMHEYNSVGMRGEPEIAWSPDGNWLAVVNQGEANATRSGVALWVMRADGSEEHPLGYGSGPHWSSDGKRLLYTQWPEPGIGGGSFQEDAHITVVETGVWQPEEIGGLLGSEIKGWLKLP